ncbi:MAG: hypothetical protein Q8P67_25140 [archaeon]|nr:hypothetical protein [archaeon]
MASTSSPDSKNARAVVLRASSARAAIASWSAYPSSPPTGDFRREPFGC